MKKLFLLTLLCIGALFVLQSFGWDDKTGTQELMEANLDIAIFCDGDEVPEANTREEWIKTGEKEND